MMYRACFSGSIVRIHVPEKGLTETSGGIWNLLACCHYTTDLVFFPKERLIEAFTTIGFPPGVSIDVKMM